MTTLTAPSKRRAGRARMSYEEYLALPDDGRIVEWVDGELIRHMPASTAHQDIVQFLVAVLRYYVNVLSLGRVLAAPYEVKVWPGGPSREPDLLFITQEKVGQLTEKRFEGAPDLVIEVISPGSITIDRVDKFREYERAGVREYWIIDPRPHQQQADFYVRDADGQFAPAPPDEAGVFTSTVVSDFRLSIAWLWQTPLPAEADVLAKLLADAPGLPEELRAIYREMARILAQG